MTWWDGFGSNHYFMFCGGSRIRDCRHCIVLLSLLHLEGENNPSGRFSSKTKMRGTGLGYALYSEIIKQGKRDNVLELIGMSLIGITQRSNFMKNRSKST
jgi:hypothetical protein